MTGGGLGPRLLSAAVLLPLVIFVTWYGDPVFSLVVALAAGVAAIEFAKLAQVAGLPAPPLLVGGLALLFVANAATDARFTDLALTAAVLVPLVRALVCGHVRQGLGEWLATTGGALYTGWLLGYFVLLRRQPDGAGWVLVAMLTTFALDTAAYFVGSAIGRHRLAPTISPRKSWEGSIAGLIAASAAAVAATQVFDLRAPIWQAAAVGLACGLVGQLGDLAESLLKRSAGVKDAGQLIPGHGGILDRVDSLLPCTIVVYYYVVWLSAASP